MAVWVKMLIGVLFLSTYAKCIASIKTLLYGTFSLLIVCPLDHCDWSYFYSRCIYLILLAFWILILVHKPCDSKEAHVSNSCQFFHCLQWMLTFKLYHWVWNIPNVREKISLDISFLSNSESASDHHDYLIWMYDRAIIVFGRGKRSLIVQGWNDITHYSQDPKYSNSTFTRNWAIPGLLEFRGLGISFLFLYWVLSSELTVDRYLVGCSLILRVQSGPSDAREWATNKVNRPRRTRRTFIYRYQGPGTTVSRGLAHWSPLHSQWARHPMFDLSERTSWSL